MKENASGAVILAPLRTYELLGERVEVVLTGEMTGDRNTILIETSPPGGGPPPHVHQREDETLTVLDGHFEVLSNGAWQPLRLGEVAFLPRGSVHTFRNAGTRAGRIAASFFPSGIERFFAELSEALALDNPAQRLREAGERAGVTFFVEEAGAEAPPSRAGAAGAGLPGAREI